MENLQNCPICSHNEFKLFLECTDYTVSKECFKIVQCKECGFKFTNPRPDEDEIGEYYLSEEYVAHSNTSKGIVNSLYQMVRKHTIQKKYKLIHSLSRNNSILDYGCGTGEFLHYFQQKGWGSTGFEPSPDARKFATDNYNLNVKSDLSPLQNESYGIITLWHVLEHIHRLKETISLLNRLLTKDGTLIIAVPNPASLDAKIYKEYWAAYDVPRHLYHFSPQDIRKLFEQIKMEVVDVLPMKFDSYYVSMLSEKNKRGKNNLPGAMINGFRSNLSTSKSGMAYSSQIYILRKL